MSGMKHNDIVLALNNETLALLLRSQFGEQGSWSNFHWVIDQEISTWKVADVANLLIEYRDPKASIIRLGVIKSIFEMGRRSISGLLPKQSLEVAKTFEFPLTKGENQYKTTKGFIDLVVHCASISIGQFRTYNKPHPMEFLIEIKKEEDFEDFGNVLRQIKEYREYYLTFGVKKWDSSIVSDKMRWNDSEFYKKEIFRACVLSTKIPEPVKELFKGENILCLELSSLTPKNAITTDSPITDKEV